MSVPGCIPHIEYREIITPAVGLGFELYVNPYLHFRVLWFYVNADFNDGALEFLNASGDLIFSLPNTASGAVGSSPHFVDAVGQFQARSISFGGTSTTVAPITLHVACSRIRYVGGGLEGAILCLSADTRQW